MKLFHNDELLAEFNEETNKITIYDAFQAMDWNGSNISYISTFFVRAENVIFSIFATNTGGLADIKIISD